MSRRPGESMSEWTSRDAKAWRAFYRWKSKNAGKRWVLYGELYETQDLVGEFITVLPDEKGDFYAVVLGVDGVMIRTLYSNLLFLDRLRLPGVPA